MRPLPQTGLRRVLVWTRAASCPSIARCAPSLPINARFATEAIVGSSTESTDNTYDLFVAIPAPSGGAVFTGPYNCMSLEFPGGAGANMRSTQFPLSQLALRQPGRPSPYSGTRPAFPRDVR